MTKTASRQSDTPAPHKAGTGATAAITPSATPKSKIPESTNPPEPDRSLSLGDRCYTLTLNFAGIRAFEAATGTGIFAFFDRAADGGRLTDDTIALFEVMAGLDCPDTSLRQWLETAPAGIAQPLMERTLRVAYHDMGMEVVPDRDA